MSLINRQQEQAGWPGGRLTSAVPGLAFCVPPPIVAMMAAFIAAMLSFTVLVNPSLGEQNVSTVTASAGSGGTNRTLPSRRAGNRDGAECAILQNAAQVERHASSQNPDPAATPAEGYSCCRLPGILRHKASPPGIVPPSLRNRSARAPPSIL